MQDFSYITQSHPAYMEGLYQQYAKDPQSVDPEFRKFFEGFDFAVSGNGAAAALNGKPTGNLDKEFAVYQLIQAYRKKGHLVAKTNPIRERKDRQANLD